jgi:basic membrane protein A and related proteins
MNPSAGRARVRTALGVVALLAVILVGACSPVTASEPAGPSGGKACELLPGPPRAGLNRSLQAAVGAAHARLGIASVVRSGLAPDIRPFVTGDCDLILGAGYQEAPTIFATASREPRQRFLLADDWFTFSDGPKLTRPNVSVLAFEADQASFLAGYVAAAVSPNHVVGVYGSVNIPTVDVALDGFLAGSRAWGEDFRRHVRILGWDGSRGLFVGNDVDQRAAASITSRLIRRGAHVIFGVAGAAALGSALVAASHPSVYLIGMYTDSYQTAPRYASKWLTSVVFSMRAPVLAAARAATSSRFSGGLYVGTLRNGGVSLAPFHRLAHRVPGPLLAKLQVLRSGLEQGWVSTNPADYVPLEKPEGPNSNG